MNDLELLDRALPVPGQDVVDAALARAIATYRPATAPARAPGGRAGRRPSRRVSRTARVVLAAAAVLALGGGIAAAFGGRIADLIRDDPTPSTIHRSFERALNPQGEHRPGEQPNRPIRSSEHLVVEQASRWGGELRIYAARSTLGASCYLLVRTTALGVSCTQRDAAPSKNPIDLISTFEARPAAKALHSELAGRPYSTRAVAVRVRFRGGGEKRVALRKGWFFYEPAPAHSMDGATPITAIDVLDARGATLATQVIQLNHVSIVQPRPVLPVHGSVRLLQRSTLPNGGGLIAIWSGRDAKGESCFRYLHNGRSQRYPAWNCGPDVGRFAYDVYNPKAQGKPIGQIPHLSISWNTYGRGGAGFEPYVYAVGWVAPGIARLELTYEDGTRTPVRLHGRFYLFLVPASHWGPGKRPRTLRGVTAFGKVVGTADLYPETLTCRYPETGGCSFATG